jgi:glutathione peroxidase
MKNKIANTILAAVASVTGFACAQTAPQNSELVTKWKDRSMYTIKTTTLEGAPVDLSQYQGKVVLVVNVASRCGFTSQYAGLQKLYDTYKDKGFVVLGIPSNDFGGQEPGSEKEIKEFCTTKYAVTFPMLSKEQTKAGSGQSEIYEFLGTRMGKLPGWNFSKYLVNKEGQPVAFYASTVAPDDKALAKAIEQALGMTSSAPPQQKPADGSAAK